MSFVALNDVASLFFQIFGDGVIMALFIFIFFVTILFLLKVNMATILIVILPMVLGLAFNKQISNLIEVEPWTFWILAMAFGLVGGGVIIISAMRN